MKIIKFQHFPSKIEKSTITHCVFGKNIDVRWVTEIRDYR